jgi:hypothetical protein
LTSMSVDKLIAAISVQSHPMVLKCLKEFKSYRVFKGTSPFGPIAAAVRLRDHYMLAIFINHIRIMKSNDRNLSLDDVLATPAIEIAIDRHSVRMVGKILQSLHSQSMKALKGFYQKALRRVINHTKGAGLAVVSIILENCLQAV